MQSFFPRLNVVEREIVLAAFNAADRSFAGVAQTLRQFALRKTNFFLLRLIRSPSLSYAILLTFE